MAMRAIPRTATPWWEPMSAELSFFSFSFLSFLSFSSSLSLVS
uniref:Uncharacterized protein n=1 Tax=Anguilla anguilla TaxID=7936 RepID=A0A0E9Q2E7_ANGAN